MIEIYLDGQTLDVSFTDETRFREFVSELERELVKAKRSIVEILLDGKRVEDRAGAAFLDTHLKEAGEVRLLTVPLQEIVLDAVDLCQRHNVQIKADIAKAVEALRLGNSTEGFVFLARVFESADMLANTLASLYDTGRRYNISLFNEPPDIYLESLVKRLEEIRSAKEAGDTVLTADLLGYELLPLIGEMEKNCRANVKNP
ncbi:MAG: hypothetical protein HY880_05105 [Deltaproteobacteria bacterium]|nr:hypothetical protein [Deltaproteobacteria bacterium]